jgi:hypothetical protein
MVKGIEEGFVNKYYVHRVPKEGQKSTDILYEQYHSLNENEIIISTFNAGMELVQERTLLCEGDRVKILTDKRISIIDSTDVEIISSAFLSFVYHDSIKLHLQGRINPERFFETRTVKKLEKDSTIAGKRALIFNEKTTIKESNKNDTAFVEASGKITFVEDLGVFHVVKRFSDATLIFKLAEQMPLSAFIELQQHNLKRIAYIDPSNTLDNNKDFKPCFSEAMIFDYYNASPHGRYADGKKEMMKIIYSKVQKDKLYSESGYLTFRFVVNCHGEAGRFVIEESSLDYEKKKFKSETVEHLFSIMRRDLTKWKPVVFDEAKDAYFYITFKLRNGEIIDILP